MKATKRGDAVSREVGDPLPWSIATEVSDATTSLVRRTRFHPSYTVREGHLLQGHLPLNQRGEYLLLYPSSCLKGVTISAMASVSPDLGPYW